MVGALCCVGRGFGSARRTGLGWVWGLALVRWAGLALVLGFGSGALGWVGSGVGVWLWCAGLGWARIWLSVYGLHCTCLFHIFMMSLCLFSCESQMCIMGLEQNKACHW